MDKLMLHKIYENRILSQNTVLLCMSLLLLINNTNFFHKKRQFFTVSKINQRVQYTVSNQGGLQVIHNRYIYHLRYFGKKNRKRLWRCVDYSTTTLKCPANICTDENNQVTERSYSHNHPFHDDKILKKLQNGIVYSIFQEAESTADGKKKERRVPINATTPECNDSSD